MAYPLCNDEANFQILGHVGVGTFGTVFKARNKITNEVVAMKKVLITNGDEGFPITAIREIKILNELEHQNVVKLIGICISQNKKVTYPHMDVCLILEYCQFDLGAIISNPVVTFTLGEIKKLMYELFEGLYYIHNNNLLHRDLKPPNILLTQDGVLKLADFGLARAYSKGKNCYTTKVVTLWYRSPEVLLKDRNHQPSLDMWSAGCIMAEMWTRTPILPGTTEQKQLVLISELCGSITPHVWPGVKQLELYPQIQLPAGNTRKVAQRFCQLVQNESALKLLNILLTLNPVDRATAKEAVNHDFFWQQPLPMEVKLDNVITSMQKSLDKQAAPLTRKPLAEKWQPGNRLLCGFNQDQHFERVY